MLMAVNLSKEVYEEDTVALQMFLLDTPAKYDGANKVKIVS
jgi:hypothetical protein